MMECYYASCEHHYKDEPFCMGQDCIFAKNLCTTCKKEFPVCEGEPIFAIDMIPELAGKDADVVIECLEYVNKEEQGG